MPAVLSRDIKRCRTFASYWLDSGKLNSTEKVGGITTSDTSDAVTELPQPYTSVKWAVDFWSYIDSNQVTIAEGLVQDIESHLNLKHSKVSFADEWAKSIPPEADGLSLDDYMVPVSAHCLLNWSSSAETSRHLNGLDIPVIIKWKTFGGNT